MTDRVKKVCFTLNNYTQEEENEIYEYCELQALFCIIGREVGESGTPHLQGYINHKKSVRFSALVKVMPRAHITRANGTDADNLAYCSKEDKEPYQIGVPQTVGKRNDLTKAIAMAKEKKTLQEIAKECPEQFIKYHRGLERLVSSFQKPRDRNDPPQVYWIWGETGVGKTRFAFDQLPEEQIYIKDSTQWWDGYSQQECILIDDFDGKWEFRDFLRLLDRYKYRGQIKGGYVEINSSFIIITCEFPPQTYWQGNGLAQVLRRITEVHNFVKAPTP